MRAPLASSDDLGLGSCPHLPLAAPRSTTNMRVKPCVSDTKPRVFRCGLQRGEPIARSHLFGGVIERLRRRECSSSLFTFGFPPQMSPELCEPQNVVSQSAEAAIA